MTTMALIGIGGYGFNLAETIHKLSQTLGCRLIAAADNRLAAFPERAQTLASRGVAFFDDALKMFEQLRGKCDIIYIATGIGSHAFFTRAALEAGFHVHLEKPPAGTIQECDQMQTAIDKSGKCLLVGFQAVHGLDLRTIKDRLVAGRIGKIKTVVCAAGWPRDAAYYARNDWAGKLRAGKSWVLDGPATNALAHQITNSLLLASNQEGLADPVSIRAEMYTSGRAESHDLAAMEIKTAQGATVYYYVSHCTDKQFGPVIEVSGQAGSVSWNMGKGGSVCSDGGPGESIAADNDARSRMVENLVLAVRAGDPSMLRCPMSQARKMVLAIDGAYESSAKVHAIDAKFTHLVDAGTPKERTVVDGLDDVIRQCAAKNALPSDLSPAPAWAAATSSFKLTDYKSFPQKFKS